MASARAYLVILLALPSAPGCGADYSDAAADIPEACNPLGGASCLMPWPSAAYLTPADTATGVQVNFPAEAMPRNFDDIPVDPAPYD